MRRFIAKNSDRLIIEDLTRDSAGREYLVGENAHLTLVVLWLNSARQEAQLVVRLTQPGATAQIIGIVLGKLKSQLCLRTLQQHEAPETSSNLLVKSVLSGEASFTYDGVIKVAKRAQKTDAYQRNENLMLSDTAHAQSKPSLEILANDVRCTHAATAGTLSAEQLWYLASRGVGAHLATKLIVFGFLKDAFGRVTDRSAADSVVARIRSKL